MVEQIAANTTVIYGITAEGRKFRPSDWAERLAGAFADHRRGRQLAYHPHIKITNIDNVKCIQIDNRLEQENPLLFQFLIHFAYDNHLKVEGDTALLQPYQRH